MDTNTLKILELCESYDIDIYSVMKIHGTVYVKEEDILNASILKKKQERIDKINNLLLT